MNLNCAVKLQRIDDSLITNNATVNQLDLSKNISVSNKTKKSTRTARKRNFKSTIIDDNYCNQPDNVKKKKCIITKPQSIKDEPDKLFPEIVPQKSTKKKKKQIFASIKQFCNNSINSDLGKISDTKLSINLHADNDTTISTQSSLKSSKNKTSIKKKSMMNNVHKNDSSNEFEKNDNIVLSKTPRKRTSKSTTSIKNKSVVYNINKDDTLKIKLEKNDPIVLTKTSKNKTPKSNTLKNKSAVKNVNKVDIINNLEGKDDSGFSRKRVRSSKKVQSQKPDSINISNNLNNGVNIPKMSVVLEKLQFIPVLPNFSEKLDDNTMMLRSNNKPPKIKKKWSDEWSGDKLSNMLKSNNDDPLIAQKIDVNNSSKLIKKAIKNQKPKNANHKKLKTKMLEKLNTITDDSLLNDNSNIRDSDSSTTNVPGILGHDNRNIIPHFNSCITNDVVPESANIHIANNDSCNIMTTSSSEVTVQSSIVPTTYTEMSNSTLSYENYQQSHLKSFEPISDSNIILSLPIITSECPEISYGISILSEAISRQCNELANKTDKPKSEEHNLNKNKSEEHDINKINSSKQDMNEIKLPKEDINEINSLKKANNPRLQLPSATVSPQRVYRNMSRKIVKYSLELYEQFEGNDSQIRLEREIVLLSKRFNIPIACLKKTVIEEPLSVFQKKYPEPENSPIVTVSPIVEKIETKSKKNKASGSLDIKYSLEPIRENGAYEKTNLYELMDELRRTMPSWSVCMVANPSRYLITHMSIDVYGIPRADKSIILDKYFRASVYLNQCLHHTYNKQYTTSTEIINLIKEVNTIEVI